jgi:DNA repair protein RadC
MTQPIYVKESDYGLPPALNPRIRPEELRPRERLCAMGPSALSDRELLALLLNSGIKGRHVALIAADLLNRLEQENSIPPVQDLAQLTGLGLPRACAVVAMLEFGRRRWGNRGTLVKHPQDIFDLVRHYADRRQERFISVSLNGAHEVLAVRLVTIGLVNRTIVHPREVFADPILDRASSIIVAHNHPSGQVEPSPEDDEITARLRRAADILGIKLLDHLVISESEFYSYRLLGRMP